MPRSFNYTNRRDISKEAAKIRISRDGEHHSFSAVLNFERYSFAQDANVYIEAYRKNQLLRFNFGKVGAIVVPQDTSLDAFGDNMMSIRFRIKVVSANTEKTILGMSKSFLAENDEGGAADCILPISRLPRDNENVWEIEYTDDGPTLAINAELDKQIVQKNYFMVLVFPAIIREVLTYAFIENKPDELGDWVEDWKAFALMLGATEFPQVTGEDREKDADLIRPWIESAVAGFVHNKNLTELANNWKDEEE